jgi:HSP20 family protein
VFETEAGVVVRVEVAGMCEGDFDIELEKRTLVITGRRHDVDSSSTLVYQQMEIVYGEFRTEVYLPASVEPSLVEALYRDGFLQVVLPKVKPTKVPIGRGGIGVEEPQNAG